jgi:hypothetical protein
MAAVVTKEAVASNAGTTTIAIADISSFFPGGRGSG